MELNKTIKVGHSTVKIILRTSNINVSKHKFRYVNGSVMMDDRNTIGTDSIPDGKNNARDFNNYISLFRVEWDGHPVRIKPEDYGNIFNASLKMAEDSYSRPSVEGSVLIIPSVKGDAFLLSIMGGQGAGTFTAWWMIRKEGVVGFCTEGPP